MNLQSKMGGWTPYRDLTPEDRTLFDKVMDPILGVRYEPSAVSTQVVAGTNYKFRAVGTIMVPDMPKFHAIIRIFEPLEGEPVLISIVRE